MEHRINNKILSTQSNLFLTHGVFQVSVLRFTANQIPLKYRGPISISNRNMLTLHVFLRCYLQRDSFDSGKDCLEDLFQVCLQSILMVLTFFHISLQGLLVVFIFLLLRRNIFSTFALCFWYDVYTPWQHVSCKNSSEGL